MSPSPLKISKISSVNSNQMLQESKTYSKVLSGGFNANKRQILI